MDNTAYLSNEGRYTIFRYGEDSLKFIAPYSLVKYEKIKEWDNGYLVVMTRYSHSQELIEEYIDLIPILKNLYLISFIINFYHLIKFFHLIILIVVYNFIFVD